MAILDRLKAQAGFFHTERFRYTAGGFVFGALFPLTATLWQMFFIGGHFFAVLSGEQNRLMLIVDTAPLVLGVVFYFLGSKQEQVAKLLQLAALDAQEETKVYRTALDQGAIVEFSDVNGVIIHVNDAFCKISGYSREELIGKEHRALNSGMMPKSFFEDLWKTIMSGRTWRGEVCNRAKNGDLFWVDTVIVPCIDRDGKVIRYFAIRYDITARKQAEAKLQTITEMRRMILESANYMIISTDVRGVVSSFNRAAEKALGYSAAEVVGKLSLDAFHHSEEIEARAAILSYELGEDVQPGIGVITEKALRSRKPDENEWTYLRKDQSSFSVRSAVSALHAEDGQVTGFLEISQDITESKKMLSELVQANEIARNSVRAKGQFLANMSHEIRTPMNGVIGMCNLLLGEVTDLGQLERLRIIQNCGNMLLDLINDILDYSKVEAGKIELENEPFPLHVTIHEVIELLSTRASEKGLTLSYVAGVGVPSWIVGDVTRFRQILTNLVGNAIKFTKTGGVTICSSSQSMGPDQFQIQIDVKDTGIGISKRGQTKLFSPFSQVDASTTRRFGGSGLGLAICKGLTERMGGVMSVASEEGKGSTFSFSLKASKAEPRESTVNANPFESVDLSNELPRSLRILVAEDNRVNQQVVCGYLKKLGYEADVAANGNEVLALLKEKAFDLILMDCHMPEKDGFETTRQICQRYPKELRPRIIALTASTMQDDIDRCNSCGMDGFVGKPVTVAALVGVIRQVKEQGPVLAQKAS